MGSKNIVIDKINEIYKKYENQFDEFWESTNYEQRSKLVQSFQETLLSEWDKEYQVLKDKNVFSATAEYLTMCIKLSYVAGYMVYNGWISVNELADFNLFLRDGLAAAVKSIKKKANSDGTAYAVAFSSISAKGTNEAFGRENLYNEPSTEDVLNEILLVEGKELISKSIKNPELLQNSTTSTTNISINPISPSDYEYLLSAFLGGPSHLVSIDSKKLEGILKRLLIDEYNKYYNSAKQRIIDERNKSRKLQ